MSYFGNQIIKLRKREGLSQEEFAYRIGVSRQIVSRWENGTAIPRATKVKIMSDEFKIPADKLFGTEESVGKNESHPVAKKRLKVMLKGIAVILIILTILYIVYFAYKFFLLKSLDEKFQEYDNWTNYYAEIKTFEEAELTAKVEIWRKDNKYKIKTENYYENGQTNKNCKWIDLDLNKRTEYDYENDKMISYEDDQTLKVHSSNYIKNYFSWIKIIKSQNIVAESANLNIIYKNKSKENVILKLNKIAVTFEENGIIPVSYVDSSLGHVMATNYNVKLNEVTDNDIEIKKDL